MLVLLAAVCGHRTAHLPHDACTKSAQVACKCVPELTLLPALQPVGDAPQRGGEVPGRRLPAAERQHRRCCGVGEAGVLICFLEVSARSTVSSQRDQPLHMCCCNLACAGGGCRIVDMHQLEVV